MKKFGVKTIPVVKTIARLEIDEKVFASMNDEDKRDIVQQFIDVNDFNAFTTSINGDVIITCRKDDERANCSLLDGVYYFILQKKGESLRLVEL